MEGVQINQAAAADGSVPFMYMAMSEVSKGMADDKGDIQVAQNKCGVVYQMKLDDNFNVQKMTPVVAGGTYDKNNAANACATDGISNPDNHRRSGKRQRSDRRRHRQPRKQCHVALESLFDVRRKTSFRNEPLKGARRPPPS